MSISAAVSLLTHLLPTRIEDGFLPERARKEIVAEQHRGDILVSVVQLGLCAVFLMLYAFSRATHPAETPFMPVPWALGTYTGFALAKFALAWRARLSDAVQVASIVVDMALLLGLIWSFHIQYDQVAAFYLKAPTLLYVFIFIALRALRFDARFVLLAGGVAAAGWLGLVTYAATSNPGGMPVTQDFVTYMTSATILWDAEIDKMISILLVTGLIAVAITRARRMLMRAVAEDVAARDLKRFFAPEIASRITMAEHGLRPGEGEIRRAATLFVDLRGFTDLSRRLEASALIRLLADYQGLLVPIIQTHGGSIDKFMGDGIMASFGATRPSATFAADAVRAVDELMVAAATWIDGLRAQGLPATGVGAALASGDVLFGCVGDESRLEYTVIGEVVNLAAKLEKHTKAERVRALATGELMDLALAQGYVRPGAPAERRVSSVAGVEGELEIAVLA
jgi:adenylate cyclase